MSDTPIAEQLAAALGMPWPLRRSWQINGVTFERPEPGALGSGIGDGGSPTGCGPAPNRAAPTLYRKDAVSEPTREQIEQMRAGAEGLAQQGVDTSGIGAVIDLVTGVDPGPE